MTHEQLYLRLMPRIRALAVKRSYGRRDMLEEMLSVADLAFWMACLDADKARIGLDNFIVLRVQNALSNLYRTERRYRKRYWLRTDTQLDHYECPYNLPASLDGASDDAQTVAWAVVCFGMRDAKRLLYKSLGWDKCWRGIDEVREALTT